MLSMSTVLLLTLFNPSTMGTPHQGRAGFCLTWLFSYDLLLFDLHVNELDEMAEWDPGASHVALFSFFFSFT